VDDRTPPRGAIPDAAKIMLVQDNLNTHKPASLYEAFPAAEARRLVERFECGESKVASPAGRRSRYGQAGPGWYKPGDNYYTQPETRPSLFGRSFGGPYYNQAQGYYGPPPVYYGPRGY
jgi:hypothetical protein